MIALLALGACDEAADPTVPMLEIDVTPSRASVAGSSGEANYASGEACVHCTLAPQVLERTTGQPNEAIHTLILDPAREYELVVGALAGKPTVQVELNGERLLIPSDLHAAESSVRISIKGQGESVLRVVLTGKPGDQLEYAVEALAPNFCTLPSLDFTDNLVPEPFEVTFARGLPGPVNERLEARPIDGYVRVQSDAYVPVGTDELVVSFTQKMNPSTWGNYVQVFFIDNEGIAFYRLYLLNSDVRYGRGGLVVLANSPEKPGYVDPVDQLRSTFNYELLDAEFRIGETSASVLVRDAATGGSLMEGVLNAPMDFARVASVWVGQVATTNTIAWSDDYSFACN